MDIESIILSRETETHVFSHIYILSNVHVHTHTYVHTLHKRGKGFWERLQKLDQESTRELGKKGQENLLKHFVSKCHMVFNKLVC